MNDGIKEDRRFARRPRSTSLLGRGSRSSERATSDPAEAHELMRGLPEDRAHGRHEGRLRLAGGARRLFQRIGIVGWWMGGGYALAFAVAEPRLAAAVVNYGKLVTDPAKDGSHPRRSPRELRSLDCGIDPKDVRAFADLLKTDQKHADIKVYDGAKHAFMNPTNRDGYDLASATDAWSRIDAWFAQNLAPH